MGLPLVIVPTMTPFLLEEDINVANPQIEDGHVDIANEIVEALARIRLSGREMQCLWVILRKTYGWHKKEDLISLSQFSLMTGLPRKTVCKVLRELSLKKVIAVTHNGDSPINLYRFNKDFDSWKPLPKKGIVSPKKVPPVTLLGTEVSPFWGHTKENIQKKLLQKKILRSANPEIKEFLTHYSKEFKIHLGTDPVIEWGKDGAIIKNLLKIIPVNDLKTLLERFFSSEDKFIIKSGYTIGIFKSQINKLKIGKVKNQGLRQWADEIKEEERNETRR